MNWGFIGFGRIARKFLESLQSVEGEIPYAFASRSNAAALRDEFPEARVYESYEALLMDDQVDVVYISTTHNFHYGNTVAALNHGKHVVCEKPLGISSAEATAMTDLAKEKNLFLLEAMWMRFLPAYREAVRRAKSGEIGKIKYITASFGFRSENSVNPDGRLMNPDLAGGALYDVGVYPLTIVSDFFGWEPTDFSAHAIQSPTKVDETIQVQLDFGEGRIAQVLGSVVMATNKEACIYGEEGFIRMPLFWKCQSFEVHKGEEVETVNMPFQSTGYAHEIIEARDCIKQGKTTSDLFSHQDSLLSAKLVESILTSVFN